VLILFEPKVGKNCRTIWDFMENKLIRFLTVGIGCAGIYFSVNYMLQTMIGLSQFVSALVAYFLSFGVAYLLQKNWTFKSSAAHSKTLARYVAAQIIAAALTAMFSQAFTEIFPSMSKAPLSIISTCIAGASSFVLSSLWVFKNVSNKSQ